MTPRSATAETRRAAAALCGPARRAVVIGASAGGPSALQRLLPDLDPDLDAAVVVVVHLGPDGPDLLPSILDASSALPVVLAEERRPVVSGLVQVAPSGYHLLVDREWHFNLTTDERVCYSRPSIDVLFKSAGEAYQDLVAGVVLTGASSDGADGLRRIRELGGVALIQEPAEAEVDTMPRAALERAGADFCGPLALIAARINRYGRR
ncbi:chemotaxis protein CheB [Xanthobacter sp. AM11]|uniref:chemotaxis protein CheB n=1 Tax=Xanthobacter sp. AM11 TaxID=3380643 RepID=UPI0039BEEE47